MGDHSHAHVRLPSIEQLIFEGEILNCIQIFILLLSKPHQGIKGPIIWIPWWVSAHMKFAESSWQWSNMAKETKTAAYQLPLFSFLSRKVNFLSLLLCMPTLLQSTVIHHLAMPPKVYPRPDQIKTQSFLCSGLRESYILLQLSCDCSKGHFTSLSLAPCLSTVQKS